MALGPDLLGRLAVRLRAMKDPGFRCTRRIPATPAEIRAAIADVERWPEFRGFGPLPGIEKAEYRERTADTVGSVIRVRNRDGSGHTERILEWTDDRVVMELGEFTAPLDRFAERFVETWSFAPDGASTRVERGLRLVPRGVLGRPFLFLISFLLKRAIARHLDDMSRGAAAGADGGAPDRPAS